MQNASHSFRVSGSPARRAWRNDAAAIDIVIAIAVAVAGELAVFRGWLGIASSLIAVKASLYSLEAQVCATMLGFLIAGAAVIAASSGLDRLKSASFQAYRTLARAFRDSMYCALFAVAYLLVVYVFDRSTDNAYWAVLALAVMALVLLRVARAARRLYFTLLL